jgi:hypothetical protein
LAAVADNSTQRFIIFTSISELLMTSAPTKGHESEETHSPCETQAACRIGPPRVPSRPVKARQCTIGLMLTEQSREAPIPIRRHHSGFGRNGRLQRSSPTGYQMRKFA